MFFRKRSKKRKKQYRNEELLRSLDGRRIKYVLKKNPTTYEETVIGRDGVMNIHDDTITIMCSNEIVFTHPFEGLRCSELMSLNGVTFRYEEKTTGQDMLIIAYYKYHRK